MRAGASPRASGSPARRHSMNPPSRRRARYPTGRKNLHRLIGHHAIGPSANNPHLSAVALLVVLFNNVVSIDAGSSATCSGPVTVNQLTVGPERAQARFSHRGNGSTALGVTTGAWAPEGGSHEFPGELDYGGQIAEVSLLHRSLLMYAIQQQS